MKQISISEISTIPDTWILLFKLNDAGNWKYLDCEEILDFPYANQLMGGNISAFQKVEKHNTKVFWCDGQIDICVDRLIEDGEDLIVK